jgi:hypothetical protein
MPNEERRNSVRTVGDWMTGHQRITHAIFLALAAVKGSLPCETYPGERKVAKMRASGRTS